MPTICIMLIFSSCSEDTPDPEVIQLLFNTSAEEGTSSPSNWWPNERDCSCTWTEEQAFLDSRSLKLASDEGAGTFCYWIQTINRDIPYGRQLRLSAMIKLDQIDPDSEGVSIAIRGDDQDDNNKLWWFTTQGDIPIKGDREWEKYSLVTKSVIPKYVDKIYVFLLLGPNTKGAVYFDDIKLEAIN